MDWSDQIGVTNPVWEFLDPNPDINSLFTEYNMNFFNGELCDVTVSWSSRMTLCAGLCKHAREKGGSCAIRLSQPILSQRPRKDLVEILLHEMIHAYIYKTYDGQDPPHGPEFIRQMARINEETGANVTVYNTFYDEVEALQKHQWACDGPCQGIIRRAMNRPPSFKGRWWAQHQNECGGTFTKVTHSGYKRKITDEPDSPVRKNQKRLKTRPVISDDSD